MLDAETQSRSRLVVRGFIWNILYRVFEVGVSFAAMLILVRVIPAHEYGRWSAVIGVLAFLNSFSSSMFLAQALQEPEDREPDWSLHWSAGLYIQTFIVVACQVVAGFCWLSHSYRPIALLLLIASVGLVLEWPAQVRSVMLKRELNFRRQKIILVYSATLRLVVTVGIALLDGGAYALVVGSNIVPAVPLVIDLLVVKGWRPRSGWWRWPDWSAYRPATRFGCQQVCSCFVTSLRGVAESAILPGTLGYVSMGLLGRSQALVGMTVARTGGVIAETLYPLLPRYSSELKRYRYYAALFVQGFLLVTLPGALYIGLEGRGVSRLVYGDRWIAADPLIWPAAVGAVGLSLFVAGSSVLLAANRLRMCLVMDFTAAVLSSSAVAVALLDGGVVHYAWALAFAQIVAAFVALWAASTLLGVKWLCAVLQAPVVSSVVATVSVVVVGSTGVGHSLSPLSLLVDTFVYGLVVGLVLRTCFPALLASVLGFIPSGERIGGWLRLPSGTIG
jgi:O-antigen/teichoic acid export membrane protein